MHFSISVIATALIAATSVQAAWPKANEYRSTNCGGSLNYGHHSLTLTDVTMDDTTGSVYLSGAHWMGYSDKTSNGGKCSGSALGVMNDKCNALNSKFSRRVKCVRRVNPSGV
ncbi:hypothetical protein N7457_008118 [Penicillium paradoxum]|uniref:uncharacterized protein n=1 Tax=Penicillium paradoxum TaxID=176176 RepID=UPI002549341C|nr:uncharacterized protein N7457_008118 [Penicillium paradoxum]KAJ5773222.1 hypothetical protein N7457_008118 [Penicillium paradoxum]